MSTESIVIRRLGMHSAVQTNPSIFCALCYLCLKQKKKKILTRHGAKSKVLICVIAVCGTTPPHAITASIRGAVSVVTAAVEKGKVAEGTVGVPTKCCDNGWN